MVSRIPSECQVSRCGSISTLYPHETIAMTISLDAAPKCVSRNLSGVPLEKKTPNQKGGVLKSKEDPALQFD